MSGLIQLLNNWGIPENFLIQATFYSVAGLTIFFALLVVLSRNIFHAAVYLAVTLLGVACVYLYLDAEFLAIVQVLIYVGAIVTLFIFTIMLTSDMYTGPLKTGVKRMLIASLTSAVIFFILFMVVEKSAWHGELRESTVLTLQELGRSLMSKYALPFEVISLISLAALVGAIVIGRRKGAE